MTAKPLGFWVTLFFYMMLCIPAGPDENYFFLLLYLW